MFSDAWSPGVEDLAGALPRHFRLRVGDWRVVYGLQGKDVLVARIFHRREGYGWLERGESLAKRSQ